MLDCRGALPTPLEGGGKKGLAKEKLVPEINRARDLALGKERWGSGTKSEEEN